MHLTPVAADPAERTLPQAVLWDMDGTLVDTEPYWIATEFELAQRHGGQWNQEHALNLVGNDLLASGRYIREHMGIELSPEAIVEELLDGVIARVRHEIPWRPGARELLARLNDVEVPCALVTMSYQRLVSPILEQLPGEGFTVVVTGDSVSRGKPHPEPYLRAAELLEVNPGDCVAIEDSDTGATSAATAGCAVLCVPHHVPVAPGANRILRSSLEGMDPFELGAISRAQQRDEHAKS